MPTYPAGSHAGFDPVPDPTKVDTIVKVLAPHYDPSIRDLRRVNGQVQSVHPVDARVTMKVTIKKNSIKSMPGFGIDIDYIAAAPPRARETAALEATRMTLADEISRGEIRLDSVRLVSARANVATRTEYLVTYANLLATDSHKPRTVTFGGR